MCGDNELYWLHREWVAKSAEQHPSLASALASSVLAPQVKRGHLPFATRFIRISFYQFCFSHGFRCLRGISLTFLMRLLHACAYMRAFPGISTFFAFHNLHTCPVSNSKNRVSVVTWNQCWKSRDCAPFQGEICEVVKNMSEKYLLRLDTKSVMRKSVKDVKAKRHKIAVVRVCAPARGERFATLFKGTFVFPY